MKAFKIEGTIYQADQTALKGALIGVFGDIIEKARVFGYELHHMEEDQELHIESTTHDKTNYTMEGFFKGRPGAFLAWIKKLCDAFLKADILYLLDYWEEDGDVDAVEVTLAHPEFRSRYVPPAG